MIDFITGTITTIYKNEITIFTGFCGLTVTVPDPSFYTLNASAHLYTYLHWHTENGPSLFGFNSIIEKKIFLLLISCSGVGPKLALGALAGLSSTTLIHAIAKQEAKVVAQAPGIGIKKAESIIVALKEKAANFIQEHACLADQSGFLIEIQQALESLGYSKQEIQHAMHRLHTENSNAAQPTSFDQQLRKALGFLHTMQR